jgi:hypothetical protein
MQNQLEIIIPIITLLIGYALNIVTSLITSSKENAQRKSIEKEKGYKEISEQLHILFEEIEY